jgi:hypothetical protein
MAVEVRTGRLRRHEDRQEGFSSTGNHRAPPLVAKVPFVWPFELAPSWSSLFSSAMVSLASWEKFSESAIDRAIIYLSRKLFLIEISLPTRVFFWGRSFE